MKTKSFLLTLLAALLLACLAQPARAQDQELKLGLSRNFGYAGGNEIQGVFTAKVSGATNLTRVTYYIDDQVMGEATQPPFSLQFSTDSYPTGQHTLYAVADTAGGQTLRTPSITLGFVTAQQGWQAGLRIAGPILVVVVLAMVISMLAAIPAGRKLRSLAPGTPRNYGALGGTICPQCGRPFPLQLFSPNLVTGKLARCPFCGKVAVMRPRSMDELRRAEAAEIKDAQASVTPEMTEEERLRKELDSSKYHDV